MPDGQHAFGFRTLPASRLRPGEIVVDLFAGGGGASTALEQALQRPVDIAINHDHFAVGMHAANHPLTRHLREDVWVAEPRALCGGRRVGWLHASPDCTHFSQAKGGQPRSRATRSLSWVVLKWAGAVRPRIISLENVAQILQWGPLVAKRDRATGRVLKLDGSIAAPGERVPVGEQFLITDKRHAGRTWRHFVAALRALDYAVEWRALKACDYGAGTSRTRLFLIARRDGEPIRWPEPTHGEGREPYITAADCIDWSIPCSSIFARRKPLADATCRRIARGIKRYVIDAAEPFFITEFANASRGATWSADEPLRVAAFLTTYYGNGDAVSLRDPLDTITTRDRLALVTVHLQGQPYVIVDIGLRMLKPRELYRAQGFPPSYIIDRTADGTPLTGTQQVRMVGNSVSPPPLAALARANLDPVEVPERIAV